MNLHENLAALLSEQGLELRELPADTGTAEQAAAAVGVPTASIVKSLVLTADGNGILVLASGDRRVDLERLKDILRIGDLRMATAAQAKAFTGFAIGGVPPLGHAETLPSYFDRRLLDHATVYAAAGTRHRLFAIQPERLLAMTRATVVDFEG